MVVASLVLELVLRSTDLREVVALLIVFRLWCAARDAARGGAAGPRRARAG